MEMYRLIREWTAWDIARRLGFAFFGIFSGTEENPEFIQSMHSNQIKSFEPLDPAAAECCCFLLTMLQM